jgi:hypothetical protein
MNMSVLFVGEEPSETAKANGWKWGDGHLCSKTLLEAFDFAGFPRHKAEFLNLFTDGQINKKNLNQIRASLTPVVGMGNKVQKVLNRYGVRHIPLIHPAARGSIRRTENYQQHVKEQLTPILEKINDAA